MNLLANETLADPLKLVPAIVRAVVRVAALPVVFWLRVGKSAATAMLGTPVPVVFFRIPVVNPANEVPLIFTTVTATEPDPLAVASPVRAVIPPEEIEAQPVALPLARIPVGAVPVEHRVGVDAKADAVAALPVVF